MLAFQEASSLFCPTNHKGYLSHDARKRVRSMLPSTAPHHLPLTLRRFPTLTYFSTIVHPHGLVLTGDLPLLSQIILHAFGLMAGRTTAISASNGDFAYVGDP